MCSIQVTRQFLTGTAILAAHLVFFVAALVPLVRNEAPPLVDYPNHLARMHIIGNLADSPHLTAFYSVDWKPIPNLAMDAFVPVLAEYVGLETAGRIFIGTVFAVIVIGCTATGYVLHRRLTVAGLLVYPFLYNGILAWGFLNYLFSVGLALCMFAGFVVSRQKQSVVGLAAVSLLGIVLYFAHLYGLAVALVLVIGYQTHQWIVTGWHLDRAALGNWLLAVIPFVIPALIFVLLSPTSAAGVGLDWGSLRRKIEALLYIFSSYTPLADALSVGLLTAVLGYLVGRGALTIDWRLGIGLLVLAVLFGAIK